VISTHLVSALLFIPLILFRTRRKRISFKWAEMRLLLSIGLVAAIRSVFQMSAIALTLVAYVISIKRTSVIFGILFGVLILKEKGLSERLTGAFIMVVGVFLIAWF
jgi:drug/metabolite transporter (DMT)-like permease